MPEDGEEDYDDGDNAIMTSMQWSEFVSMVHGDVFCHFVLRCVGGGWRAMATCRSRIPPAQPAAACSTPFPILFPVSCLTFMAETELQ